MPVTAIARFVPLLLLCVALADPPTAPPRAPKDELPAEFGSVIPYGLPAAVVPAGAADASLRVLLGRKLFFDPILSRDRTIACASCHDPAHGFSRPEPRAIGISGQVGPRNAPTLFNRGFGEHFTWDGRFRSLAEQALDPIQNPIEMDLPVEQAVSRLAADADYAERFAAAYSGAPNAERLCDALAAFEARILIGDSPIDRFRSGEVYGALSESERAGVWTYESKGKCWRCHRGPNFSDEQFHNTGVGVRDGLAEPGRAAITGKAEDTGAFKTPTLRGLAFTAPFMHDGSLATIEQVIEFYARGGGKNAHLDPRMEPIEFTETEKADLAAFLRALSRRSERN